LDFVQFDKWQLLSTFVKLWSFQCNSEIKYLGR
jgi:hypothetical protein